MLPAEEIPEAAAMKKTLGRRRIPIRKIENKPNRHVSFSKRRAGLFKKASELSTLCGSEIAVIVFSEAGNAFAYSHPSADSVIQRYVNFPDSPPQNPIHPQSAGNGIRKFCNNDEAIQWENRISRLGLNELKLYASHLQKIRDIVTVKAASMAPPSGYVADQKNVAVSDHGNQNSNCFDDVNWGDIESDMANSPMISPDCRKPFEAELSYDEYMQLGDGALDDGYLHSDVIPTSSSSGFQVDTQSSYAHMQFGDGALDGGYLHSDVMPTSSSSSGFQVDTQIYSSLCDIQWEEEDGFDLFASSLQDLISN